MNTHRMKSPASEQPKRKYTSRACEECRRRRAKVRELQRPYSWETSNRPMTFTSTQTPNLGRARVSVQPSPATIADTLSV